MFIEVYVLPSGPISTNAYVVACPRTREAAIIDPSPMSFVKIQDCLKEQNLDPRYLLLTHSHWDHIADAAQCKKMYPKIIVAVHPLDAPNLKEPGIDDLPFSVPIDPVEPNLLLGEGTQISLGDLLFYTIHVPGHSPGSVCFYEPKQNVLFSGDTLFKGGRGSTSLPTGQPALMRSSLVRLSQLPAETRIYSGHGPDTIMKEERYLWEY